MSDDRLAEIKRSMEYMVPSDDGYDDIDWLIDEVVRLREAVTALTVAVEAGVEAFRLTREYIGEALPQFEGWAWFDWQEAAIATLAVTGGE